jgi:hypothetical protein
MADSTSEQPELIEVPPNERFSAVEGILARMKQEQLTPLEEYVMQKAVVIFLTGERAGWGTLYGKIVRDALSELSPTPRYEDDESRNDFIIAINGLEGKGLLHIDDSEPDAGLRIGAIISDKSALIRSVYHFERKSDLSNWFASS